MYHDYFAGILAAIIESADAIEKETMLGARHFMLLLFMHLRAQNCLFLIFYYIMNEPFTIRV